MGLYAPRLRAVFKLAGSSNGESFVVWMKTQKDAAKAERDQAVRNAINQFNAAS